MTMNVAPFGSVPISKTRTTFSLWIDAAARASRMKRAVAPERSAFCGARNLIATLRPREVSSAPSTTPIPPRPMMASTRYFPSSTSPGCGSWFMGGANGPGRVLFMGSRS